MTLPFERYHALSQTEQFLKDLMDHKVTPRVPKAVRQRASSCLKHYPQKHYRDVLATRSPDVIETPQPVDDLSMLIYDREKRNNHG
jgi:hypothetical protein